MFLRFFVLILSVFYSVAASYNSEAEAQLGVTLGTCEPTRALVVYLRDQDGDTCTGLGSGSGVFLSPRHILTARHNADDSLLRLKAGKKINLMVGYGAKTLPETEEWGDGNESDRRVSTEECLKPIRASGTHFSTVEKIIIPQTTFMLNAEDVKANIGGLIHLFRKLYDEQNTYILGDDIALLCLAEDIAPWVLVFPRICSAGYLEHGQCIDVKVVASAGAIVYTPNGLETAPVRLGDMGTPHVYGGRVQYNASRRTVSFDSLTYREEIPSDTPSAFPIKGNSGSPALMQIGDDAVVMAIVSGTYPCYPHSLPASLIDPKTGDIVGTMGDDSATPPVPLLKKTFAATQLHSFWINKVLAGEPLPRFLHPFFINDQDASTQPSWSFSCPDENTITVLLNRPDGCGIIGGSLSRDDVQHSALYEDIDAIQKIPSRILVPNILTTTPNSMMIGHKATMAPGAPPPSMTAPAIIFNQFMVEGTEQIIINKHPHYPAYVRSFVFERLPGAACIFIHGSIDFVHPIPNFGSDGLLTYGCTVRMELI